MEAYAPEPSQATKLRPDVARLTAECAERHARILNDPDRFINPRRLLGVFRRELKRVCGVNAPAAMEDDRQFDAAEDLYVVILEQRGTL